MRVLLITLMLAPLSAWAINKPPEPPMSKPLTLEIDVAQQQQQAQGQIATGGNAEAHGGNAEAIATGGQGGRATASAYSDPFAYSGGNDMRVETTYRQVRQAPSVSSGALIIPQCGAGGNAGGSNTGGSFIMGFSWTRQDCIDFLVSSHYEAMGYRQAACHMINGTRAARKSFRRQNVTPPDCTRRSDILEVLEKVEYITAEELAREVQKLQESQDRAWRASQGDRK